ncbi:hypothetical protein C900_00737 [Fulvivirga imtechensis AK7]|uniref:Uncharacterized protein n=1 Tax=Fulvivirga imtechensis AK7 TaxID=1237149 RepID=L8JUW6_9BACT|nr:hypothetical protein [Fulvivirga imtechensis]ELR72776.1 hypothetical protein C900_00737 [Fulvivirga imtechensis AK7]
MRKTLTAFKTTRHTYFTLNGFYYIKENQANNLIDQGQEAASDHHRNYKHLKALPGVNPMTNYYRRDQSYGVETYARFLLLCTGIE